MQSACLLPRLALWAVVSFAVELGALAGEAQDQVVSCRDVMVAMRDGVRLATDVYLPAGADRAPAARKLPAILTRMPYNKDSARSLGLYYAARGYAFVAQDTRGRYKSEGVWHWMSDDGPDGCDTADWLVKQPWSNGRFGMIGTSYVGGTQHAMAMANAPGLTTVIPVDAVCNMGYHGMRNGGAFELRFWNWIHAIAASKGSRQARDPGTAAALAELMENRRAYLMCLPLRRGTTPLKLAPEYEDWLVEAMRHGANDDYWKQNNIVDYPEKYKDIPVYLVGGWYDSWGASTTASYAALSKRLTSPVYLIMGPWIHGAQNSSAHGQVDFSPAAAIADPLAWRLAWYDRWLKGIDNEVGKREPFATRVRIFVMGTGDGHKTEDGKLSHGGYWRDAADYPLPEAQPTNYYLYGDGSLATAAPSEKTSSTTFDFDPQNPVPTIGGCTCCAREIMTDGAWNQWGGEHTWTWPKPIPLSARNDVVVFTTPPLERDTEIIGPIHVQLWASSSAVDTDFTAKLIDVYPSSPDFPAGFDLIMGDGIIRARYRDSDQAEEMMTPGEVYRFHIKLDPCCNVFKKGHRIRVDISSSNFPRFDVNPNTGEPPNNQRRTITATNTIYHDATHPSHIVLPLLPARSGDMLDSPGSS